MPRFFPVGLSIGDDPDFVAENILYKRDLFGVIGDAKHIIFTPDANLMHTNQPINWRRNNTSWEKAKETDIKYVSGSLRLSYEIKAQGQTAYGRVRRNGVEVGTEQSTTSISFVEFEEDIAGWSRDDLYQIYCMCSADQSTAVQAQKIKGIGVKGTFIEPVNQDPESEL